MSYQIGMLPVLRGLWCVREDTHGAVAPGTSVARLLSLLDDDAIKEMLAVISAH
jgi:hypothetical protein